VAFKRDDGGFATGAAQADAGEADLFGAHAEGNLWLSAKSANFLAVCKDSLSSYLIKRQSRQLQMSA
jgi:hypothetical protein